ncbi:MAG: RNA-binding protein [Chloroflexota bacterium]
MNIYVGNLPYRTTDDDLREAFQAHGEVTSVNIIMDKFSGQSKGFGFVEMSDDAAANAAIKALDGQDFQGRNLKVNQARPREDRSSGGGGRRDRY